MKTITQTYKIHAPANVVWDALINPRTIEKWGGGPSEMSEKEGYAFTLWGGEIYGTNKKVVKEKELIQDWYGGKWEEPSKLTFLLTGRKNETELMLTQTNVPDNEVNEIREGWKTYYLGPLKEWVEKHKLQAM